MNPARLAALLADVAGGRVSVESAREQLRHLPIEHLPYAQLDHHRSLRQGHPEVIFCDGKTAEQVTEIAERLVAATGQFLGTRASVAQADAVITALPATIWNPTARTLWQPAADREHPKGPPVLIVTAGTSDLSVGEEAAVCAEAFGMVVERLTDVGVAGLHRILAATEALDRAGVLIVVAGMEGALPSVVGGLVRQPVIAVPTSVGYGAAFGGVAALLGMLNSCAAGVTVVNIDNGFGAAAAAARILRGGAV